MLRNQNGIFFDGITGQSHWSRLQIRISPAPLETWRPRPTPEKRDYRQLGIGKSHIPKTRLSRTYARRDLAGRFNRSPLSGLFANVTIRTYFLRLYSPPQVSLRLWGYGPSYWRSRSTTGRQQLRVSQNRVGAFMVVGRVKV